MESLTFDVYWINYAITHKLQKKNKSNYIMYGELDLKNIDKKI